MTRETAPTTSLILNGEPADVSARTVAELVQELGLANRPVAVMVNEAVVKKKAFGETALHPGDQVEVISLIGGG